MGGASADPGRAGMARPLLAWLRGCTARRLVYVSCNPVTQVRPPAFEQTSFEIGVEKDGGGAGSV